MTTITATPATLAAGLKACASGDVITLAPGDYGPLAIAKRTFDPPLTIKSADPAQPARFTRAAIAGGGVGLVGLVFAYAPDMTTPPLDWGDGTHAGARAPVVTDANQGWNQAA